MSFNKCHTLMPTFTHEYQFTFLIYLCTTLPSPLVFPIPPSLRQLLPSFRLSSLRCHISIMASCDDDVLSSSTKMQHARAHIIRAECIRCYLCECTTARSLCVKLFCGKQEKRRGTIGEKSFSCSVQCVKTF